ncbi:MAG: hypothetical protein ABIN94_05125, partial [Ferruginibacter sp.]
SLFLIFCLLDYLFYGTQGTTPGSGPLVVECLFFLVVILYYFYEKMKFVASTPIYKSASFWLALAFLIYFSGTFLLFLASGSSMVHDQNFIRNYNIIYGTVAVVKNLLIAVGIIVHRFSKKDAQIDLLTANLDLDSLQSLNQNTNLSGRK